MHESRSFANGEESVKEERSAASLRNDFVAIPLSSFAEEH
jgi:hypothetical protein